ncbi:hypothetical protein LTR86_004796 [Recurvomyces mirabilis]|nr:hypothetical protein LTR86_004796 [Recurvomyces mirabilis]
MSTLLLYSSVILAILGSVDASAVCTSAPYSKFLPLLNYPIAASLCSQLFLVSPVTETVAASTSTVITTVASTTIPVTVSTFFATTTTSTLTVDILRLCKLFIRS